MSWIFYTHAVLVHAVCAASQTLLVFIKIYYFPGGRRFYKKTSMSPLSANHPAKSIVDDAVDAAFTFSRAEPPFLLLNGLEPPFLLLEEPPFILLEFANHPAKKPPLHRLESVNHILFIEVMLKTGVVRNRTHDVRSREKTQSDLAVRVHIMQGRYRHLIHGDHIDLEERRFVHDGVDFDRLDEVLLLEAFIGRSVVFLLPLALTRGRHERAEYLRRKFTL